MKRLFLVLSVLALLVYASPAHAQGIQTGTITGTVKSADGLSLPGATVTASSPVLQGQRTGTTDVNGVYFIRGLPAGAYVVSFEMPSFKAVRKEKIELNVGSTIDVPLRFDFSEEGNNYRGDYTPDEMGLYKIDLSANRGKVGAGTAQSNFLVTELNREFHDAAQNAELLKRIAAETGGKYFPLAEVGKMLEELQYLEGTNSERVSKDLWDMPINLLLLVGLASAEWFLRKKKGLA